ncbi:MAG: hypothetical protein ABFC57_13525 [Veillonellales bacterium]
MKEAAASIDKIEADWIIVEVIDKNTGRMFRRNLPVKYLETDNGLVLSGETLDGSPSQINFFSEAALAKVQDLLGRGPDFPQCSDR